MACLGEHEAIASWKFGAASLTGVSSWPRPSSWWHHEELSGRSGSGVSWDLYLTMPPASNRAGLSWIIGLGRPPILSSAGWSLWLIPLFCYWLLLSLQSPIACGGSIECYLCSWPPTISSLTIPRLRPLKDVMILIRYVSIQFKIKGRNWSRN